MVVEGLPSVARTPTVTGGLAPSSPAFVTGDSVSGDSFSGDSFSGDSVSLEGWVGGVVGGWVGASSPPVASALVLVLSLLGSGGVVPAIGELSVQHASSNVCVS